MKPLRSALRNLFTIAYDAGLAGATFVAALYLRWAEEMWDYAASYWWQGAAAASALMLVFVLYSRLYRRFWRYVSLKDITTILKVCAVSLALFYAGFFLLNRLEMLPRSVPVIHLLLLLSVMIAPRVLYRAVHEKRLALPENQQIPVLLVGTTAEAESFIRESVRHKHFPYRVVGVIASDPATVGRNIHHVRVYGDRTEVPTVLRKLKRKGNAPQRLILADRELDGEAVRALLAVAEQENISLARMPRLSDLTRGDGAAVQMRPIDVEDILGRPQTALDVDAMAEVIAGKVVLVTGAGGSIGSELARQIAGFGPKRIVLFEQNEYALYQIDRELSEHFADCARKAILGDVRRRELLDQVFAEHRPDVVFHAAALKHVPLCEMNMAESVLTNVIGTQQVADACLAAGVGLMVQISTDKAVNPTNVMGTCKRIGESYAQALGQAQKPGEAATRFATVRFGNVLGSTGSVVPLFEQQLQRGGPLTITHKDMTRYFMTIREAVQLVLQAAALVRKDSELAPIYVLDMGKPIKIEDLAVQMIRLAGLRPHEDIQLSYTGLRPGEKLHEELFYGSEALRPTAHESIQLAEARSVALKPLQKLIDQLHKAALKRQDSAMLMVLKELVPEYQAPQEKKESA